jgi:hypothetical protein
LALKIFPTEPHDSLENRLTAWSLADDSVIPARL